MGHLLLGISVLEPTSDTMLCIKAHTHMSDILESACLFKSKVNYGVPYVTHSKPNENILQSNVHQLREVRTCRRIFFFKHFIVSMN